MDNPHENHRQRMAGRVLEKGADTLLDHELLEMLLYYALPRKDTNPIAHRLLKEFGSLRAVLSASPRELQRIEGIGPQSTLLFSLLQETIGRYERGQFGKKVVLDTVRKSIAYCKSLYVGVKYERIYLIFLNIHCQIIRTACIGEGDLGAVPVYTKRAVEEAIHASAHYAIMTHNHPGGIAQPSDQDLEATDHICRALATVDVRLNDHIIIGANDFCSFVAERWMNELVINADYRLAEQQINFKNRTKKIE